MRYLFQPIKRYLDRIQQNLVRRRPGSILIFVIVLVTLLALLGTAVLSTTRSDRYVSAQNTANTQIDLLIEGVKEIARSTIQADLYGTGTYMPPLDSSVPTTALTSNYENWDIPDVVDATTTALTPQNDAWLSSRLPTLNLADPGFGDPTQPLNGVVYWPAMGQLPGITEFASPFILSDNSGYPASQFSPGGTFIQRLSNQNQPFTPEFARVGGQTYPTFKVTLSGGGIGHVLAGDADGDGMADSAFFKLPVGELDGVTYYAAARIIDNNSAVNVNTAFSSTADYNLSNNVDSDALGGPLTGTPPLTNNLGMFRAHVGLKEMFNSASSLAEGTALLQYRRAGTPSQLRNTAFDDTSGSPLAVGTFTTRGELMEMQLARRVDSPGSIDVAGTATTVLQATTTDASALAYHFVFALPGGSQSPLEAALSVGAQAGAATIDSLYSTAANVRSGAMKGLRTYGYGQLPNWYDLNFNFDGRIANLQFYGNMTMNQAATPPQRPIRSILTTHNPVSNQIAMRFDGTGKLPDDVSWLVHMQPYGTGTKHEVPSKTNINTAPFEELWRAFWCVMSENPTSTGTPFNDTPQPNPTTDIDGPFLGMKFDTTTQSGSAQNVDINTQRMFRSSIRDMRTGASTAYFEPKTMVLLRSAIAAMQTLQLRDPNSVSVVQPIKLPMIGSASGTVNVKIYPAQKQLFLTEVYVFTNSNNKNSTIVNTGPYVALKLFNPNNTDLVINDYKINYYVRKSGSLWKMPMLTSGIQSKIIPTMTIPANGYLVIDNLDTSAAKMGPVTVRPQSSNLPIDGDVTGTNVVYLSMPDLTDCLDNEILIAQGSLPDAIPIDSYDFTNIQFTNTGGNAEIYHYSRATRGIQSERIWQCVYPGRYFAAASNTGPRQQGTEHVQFSASVGDPALNDAAIVGQITNVTLNLPADKGTIPASIQIPYGNQDNAGPNKGTSYPNGAFARDGDILQVPFIAAYVITDGTDIYEMNTVSMDSAFAEDSDIYDDYPQNPLDPTDPAAPQPKLPDIDKDGQREQVGRFCPLFIRNASDGPSLDAANALVNDFDDSTPTKILRHRYAWARKLFDYFCVQSPASDYQPEDYTKILAGSGVKPVDNDGDGAAGEQDSTLTGNATNFGLEDRLPVQGLININTADWKVLSAIPWLPRTTTGTDKYQMAFTTPPGPRLIQTTSDTRDDNEDIARAIVYYRDGDPSHNVPGHGAFKSIFDLYRIPFLNSAGDVVPLFDVLQRNLFASTDPGIPQGDLLGPDNVRNDFKEQYFLLTKVSNLLTTRSDSFTVYIVVQGWRGVGGTRPELVVQRRAAFIQDRWNVMGTGVSNGRTALSSQWINIAND